MDKRINHPDELWEALQDERTRWATATGGRSDYRKGVEEGLRLAMNMVEAHTVILPAKAAGT